MVKFVLASVMCCFFISCSKDSDQQQKNQLDFSITQIEKSFKEQYTSYSQPPNVKKLASVGGQSGTGVIDNKYILWNYSYTEDFVNDGYPVNLTPIVGADVSSKYFNDMTPKGYRLLAAQHNTDKSKVLFNFREIYPDQSYINLKMGKSGISAFPTNYIEYARLVDRNDFSGYIIYYQQDLTPMSAEKCVNGKVVNFYNIAL